MKPKPMKIPDTKVRPVGRARTTEALLDRLERERKKRAKKKGK